MDKAQELIYLWIKEIGEVSYERIKQTCIFLNTKFNLSLEKPIHQIFYPLLYNGVIEFSGNGRFCVTPECIISKDKTNYIAINSGITDNSLSMVSVGIQTSKSLNALPFKNIYNFKLELILAQIPNIKSCVLSFHPVNLKASDFENLHGVSKKKNDSQKYYFLCPESGVFYTIPHQSLNPDALNIAICYERVINSNSNGTYNINLRELRFNMHHMPILIYRLLMIESLFYGKMPYLENGFYVFNNITRKAYYEMNRIFCQSIKTI